MDENAVNAVVAALRWLVAKADAGYLTGTEYGAQCAYCDAVDYSERDLADKHERGCPILLGRKALEEYGTRGVYD